MNFVTGGDLSAQNKALLTVESNGETGVLKSNGVMVATLTPNGSYKHIVLQPVYSAEDRTKSGLDYDANGFAKLQFGDGSYAN